MLRILHKAAPDLQEDPRFLLLRYRSWFTISGMILLLIAVSARPALAETYSIQIGIFKHQGNARLSYTSIYNALPDGYRKSLRIEKSENLYTLRLGRFETQAQAEALLPLIKTMAPEAFIRKDGVPPEEILQPKTKSPDSFSEPAAGIKPPDPGLPKGEGKSYGKAVKPIIPEEGGLVAGPTARGETAETTRTDAAIPANRAWLWGSIREISPLPREQLGSKPGKEIFRLILQVEETKKIAGYPNLLAEKEGGQLTVFSETASPFFKVGGKIKAVVEYRGNRYGRFFWITRTEAP